jgi:hypothetical protein
MSDFSFPNIIGLSSISHLLGAAGSFLLLLAPAADQLRRLKMTKWLSSANTAPSALKETALRATTTLAAGQMRWKPWESFVMALGGLLLMMSFWG